MPCFSNKIWVEFVWLLATIAKPSIEDCSSITPFQLFSAQMMEMTSLMDGSLFFPRPWTRTWSNSSLSPVRNSKICFLSTFFEHYYIFTTFQPQNLHDIGIFGHRFGSLFCGGNLHLDFKILSRISYLWIGLSDGFPNLLSCCKKYTCSAYFRVIEFHNQDMIMESSSSQLWNFGSSGFGLVLIKWHSFPLPFRKVHTNWNCWR